MNELLNPMGIAESALEKRVDVRESANTRDHYIYILSDGTGETAANLVRALITQFSGASGIFTRRYSKVKDVRGIDRILDSAKQSGVPVFITYTLVNSELREYLRKGIGDRGLKGYDLFTTLLSELSAFLGTKPEENPDKFHGVNDQYFKRMEAIEFTLRHDDGKTVTGLEDADIVLVGVSRTGKTPLSIYLSLYAYKVVNIPLAKGVRPPSELDSIQQNKIVALTIDPSVLVEIRKKRMTGLSVSRSEYSSAQAILEELEEANVYFRRHRRWPVINVTNRSIEETAALVRDKVYGPYRKLN